MKRFTNLALGTVLVAMIALTTWAANTKLRSVAIINSTIDSTTIGATTPSTGVFTTVTASGLGSFGVVSPVIQAVCTPATLTSNVSVSASTVTTVTGEVITCPMPSSGCPCRVWVDYSMYWNMAANKPDTDFWVTDGTNSFAPSQSTNGNVGNTGGNAAGEFSPVTYANSASPVFTLKVESNFAITVQAAPTNAGAPNGVMRAAIFTSN